MSVSKKKKGELSFLEFSLLSPFPELIHGVFLRCGGASKGPFASLNVSESVQDDDRHVKKNLSLIQHTLGIKSLHHAIQVHDTTLCLVEKGSPLRFDACDGLITKERGAGLLIKHADCQAALFYDPNQEIIGAAHAGWKGNVKRIYTKMIELFQELGSHPRDILVCISPSLGPDHAEFKEYEKTFPPSFWPFQVKSNYFDLWAVATRELLDAGIYEKHIDIARQCAYCQSNDFFSFRREGVTGRNGTIIALKS